MKCWLLASFGILSLILFGTEVTSRDTGEIEEGEMSYYSVETNGTETASGELLSDSKPTAAHRTLPMGTWVKVTNLMNGKTARVRINDRGPFVEGRIIDVAIGVARKLEFVDRGIAPCRIEVLPSGAVR
ncbi:MAG: septal ring lytic transglycosylase RlpA family protein [Verrucomicrobiota bacterium]